MDVMDFSKEIMDAFHCIWGQWNKNLEANFAVICPSVKSNVEAEDARHAAQGYMLAGDYTKSCFTFKQALVMAEYNSYVFGQVLYEYVELKILQRNYSKALKLLNQCSSTAYGKLHYVEVATRKIKVCGLLGEKKEQQTIYDNLAEIVKNNNTGEQKLDEAKSYLNIPMDRDAFIDEDFKANTGATLFQLAALNAEEYYIAKKSIKRGQIILVERPEATAGLDYCIKCFKKCIIIIPCKYCIHPVYCSENCRDKDEFHTIECGFFRSGVMFTNDAKSMLALRLFLVNFDFEMVDGEVAMYELKVVSSHFLHLTLSKQKYTKSDFIMQSTVANAIYLTSYFLSVRNDLRSSYILIGVVFMKLLISIQQKLFLSASSNHETNFMVYLHYSQFCHSCNPNTIKYLSGSKLVVKAVRDIEQGEVLSINYGSVNWMMEKSRRKAFLAKFYCYECKCDMCVGPSLVYFYSIIKCEQCPGYLSLKIDCLVCEKCGKKVPHKKELFVAVRKIYNLVTHYQISHNVSDLYKAIEDGKRIGINPGHPIISLAYFQMALQEVRKGQLGRCLDYLQDITVDQFNCNQYVFIIKMLELKIKQLFKTDKSPYQITELGKGDVERYIKFLTDMTEAVKVYYPKDSVLNALTKLKKFYMVLRTIVEFESIVDWHK